MRPDGDSVACALAVEDGQAVSLLPEPEDHPMDRVDAHVHVFAPASEDYPREVSGLAPARRAATVEQLLREMDGARIDRAVLIQMGGFETEHHRYLARALYLWPDRLAGVGLVDLFDPDPPARIRELHEATGIRGLRLMGQLGSPDAATVEELPACGLFERAGELGLHVNLYCPSDQIDNMERVVRAMPSVTFSLDHLGICAATAPTIDRWKRPRFEDEPVPPATFRRVLALARYPNVCVKVSGEYAFSKMAYPFADMRPMVEQVYEAYGAERMMWCSDFPWICEEPGYARLSELIDHHLPRIPGSERDSIMGGNALRIWFGG